METPAWLQTLYHAIDPADWIFGNNIRLTEGRVTAMSLTRSTGEVPDGVMSPYEAFMADSDTEAVFERVRSEEFPHLPTRLGAIFLFPDEGTGTKANAQWWNNGRVMLPASVTLIRRAGIFDSRKLNAEAENWERAAREYWAGARTNDPLLEVVLEGVVQLKGWEPYGTFGPRPAT